MTTWTNDERYAGSASTTYDDATATYDDESLNYDGQEITVWTEDTVST